MKKRLSEFVREGMRLRHRLTGLRPGTAILLYHHVLPERGDDPRGTRVSLRCFAEHLDYLVARYEIQPLGRIVDDLLEGRRPERPRAAISFDDGFADNLLFAYPELQKRNLPATIFLATGRIDGSEPESLPRERRFLSWSEVRTMRASGAVTFGAHSHSHVRLPPLAPAEVEMEVTRSRARITEELGAAVDLFAYPFGEFTAATREIVKRAGFRAAFGAEPGIVTPATPRFAIPRIPVLEWNVRKLEQKILRAWTGRIDCTDALAGN